MSREFCKKYEFAMVIGFIFLMPMSCGEDLSEALKDNFGCREITPANKKFCAKKELEDALTIKGNKKFFQIHEPIELLLSNELIEFGEQVSIFNMNRKLTLIEDVSHSPSHANLNSYVNKFGETEYLLSVFPWTLDSNLFDWGVDKRNRLRVVVSSAYGSDYRYVDFDVFLFSDAMVEEGGFYSFSDEVFGRVDFWFSSREEKFLGNSEISVRLGNLNNFIQK